MTSTCKLQGKHRAEWRDLLKGEHYQERAQRGERFRANFRTKSLRAAHSDPQRKQTQKVRAKGKL